MIRCMFVRISNYFCLLDTMNTFDTSVNLCLFNSPSASRICSQTWETTSPQKKSNRHGKRPHWRRECSTTKPSPESSRVKRRTQNKHFSNQSKPFPHISIKTLCILLYKICYVTPYVYFYFAVR